MRFAIIAGSILTSALALTACAPADYSAGDRAPQLTEKQQAKLDKKLAGRVPGEPVSCIWQARNLNYTAISDDVLIYERGNTVYVNQPYGGCNGAEDYALVTRNTTSRLCSGQIAHVADLQLGMNVGSCALGKFTPYRKTGDAAD